ncbi:MAG TPA: SgcJ/EcaC family oxidoreductase [Kofleriaceae bacterium]
MDDAIRAAHVTWIDAVNAGDLSTLLAAMTDDVVFLGPGQDPFGRDGFTSNFSQSKDRIRFHCVSELEEVVVVGDVAYARARDSLSVTPRDGSAPMELAGYRLTVYRNVAGRWLLARDAHTLTPAR